MKPQVLLEAIPPLQAPAPPTVSRFFALPVPRGKTVGLRTARSIPLHRASASPHMDRDSAPRFPRSHITLVGGNFPFPNGVLLRPTGGGFLLPPFPRHNPDYNSARTGNSQKLCVCVCVCGENTNCLCPRSKLLRHIHLQLFCCGWDALRARESESEREREEAKEAYSFQMMSRRSTNRSPIEWHAAICSLGVRDALGRLQVVASEAAVAVLRQYFASAPVNSGAEATWHWLDDDDDQNDDRVEGMTEETIIPRSLDGAETDVAPWATRDASERVRCLLPNGSFQQQECGEPPLLDASSAALLRPLLRSSVRLFEGIVQSKRFSPVAAVRILMRGVYLTLLVPSAGVPALVLEAASSASESLQLARVVQRGVKAADVLADADLADFLSVGGGADEVSRGAVSGSESGESAPVLFAFLVSLFDAWWSVGFVVGFGTATACNKHAAAMTFSLLVGGCLRRLADVAFSSDDAAVRRRHAESTAALILSSVCTIRGTSQALLGSPAEVQTSWLPRVINVDRPVHLQTPRPTENDATADSTTTMMCGAERRRPQLLADELETAVTGLVRSPYHVRIRNVDRATFVPQAVTVNDVETLRCHERKALAARSRAKALREGYLKTEQQTIRAFCIRHGLPVAGGEARPSRGVRSAGHVPPPALFAPAINGCLEEVVLRRACLSEM